jgi:TldD protein
MDRRDFLAASGIGLGGLVLPGFGNAVAAEVLLSTMDVASKKALANVALNAATSAGASYCDVRIGRYMRQFVITRETRVENVVNTESTGVGIRVIANGTWGFAATSDLTSVGIAKAAKQAVAIAKANSKSQASAVSCRKRRG